MQINEATFERCILKLGYVPFEQDEGWRKFQRQKGNEFLFFVDNEVQPHIACCGRVLSKPLLGRILDVMGEVMTDEAVSEKILKEFFQMLIKDAACNMIVYNSTSVYSADKEIALRRAGFNRPFGSRTCPLTIFVDLQNDSNAKRDRNWKRNVKKAIDNHLEFTYVEKPKMEDAVIVCQMFKELSENKHLGYTLNQEGLFQLLSNPNYRLYYVCHEGHPICARIVYHCKNMAEDVFAANSNESRLFSATHFMMECVFSDLSKMGLETFDFSRIPPSTNETDSVYVFKRASGGDNIQYLGEWVWAKNRILPFLFSVFNFFVRKAHHY